MIDWHRIQTELQRYPRQGDICLYHIGTHAGLLSEADVNRMQGGQLPPDLRRASIELVTDTRQRH